MMKTCELNSHELGSNGQKLMSPRERLYFTLEEIDAPSDGQPFLKRPFVEPRTMMKISGILCACVFVISGVIFGVCLFNKCVLPLILLTAFWAVTPPIWFWYCYFGVYRNYGRPGTFELYKYGQQVSAAIWAGGLLLLAATLSSDYLDESNESENSCLACNSQHVHSAQITPKLQ